MDNLSQETQDLQTSSTNEVSYSLSVSMSGLQQASFVENESMMSESQVLSARGLTDSFYETDSHDQQISTDRNSNKTPEKLCRVDIHNISASKSSLKIGADLYERGLKILDHKKAFPDEFIKANYSFKPRISTNSEKLIKENKVNRKPLYDPKPKQDTTDKNSSAKKLQGKELEDFIKRNYNSQLENYKVKKQRPSPERNVPDSECTFKPKLNPASLEMVPNRGLLDDIYYRGLKSKEIKKQKEQEHLKEKEKAEVKGCTFRPNIVRSMNLSPRHKRRDYYPKNKSTYYSFKSKAGSTTPEALRLSLTPKP